MDFPPGQIEEGGVNATRRELRSVPAVSQNTYDMHQNAGYLGQSESLGIL